MPRKEKAEIFKVKSCRICGNKNLLTFLQLGPMPIPNGFLEDWQLNSPEKSYPLDISFCDQCGITQLAHVISPEIMFQNYVYVPSTSTTMVTHFSSLAKDIVKKADLKPHDLVIDIGSNDGTLLKSFKSSGMKVLGIDPAKNLAQKASQDGIKTLNKLFTKKIAQNIKSNFGPAKVITATNVVAHVNDLHDFFEGIKLLLAKDGLFLAEFPYFIDLMEKVEFDTFYHEHLSYLSITPLVHLAKLHGISLLDIRRIPIHGGSIRMIASTKSSNNNNNNVQNLLKYEQKKGILNPQTYLRFRKKVDTIRHNLVHLLWKLKLKDKRLAGYGASAKGNVLLNYCRIGPETLDYIVDSIPYKQGKFTPGMHIPIYPESKLSQDMPHYALILAWNFADEIIKKQNNYLKRGGKFIVTIPSLKII